MREYELRAVNLKVLGYETYADYLSGSLWRRIRKNALKLAEGNCCCCGDKATEVHHRDYELETLKTGGEFSLVPLCNACHNLAEFDTNGRKRTPTQANRFLDGVSARNKETSATKQKKDPRKWHNGVHVSQMTKKQRKWVKRRKNKDKSWTSI